MIMLNLVYDTYQISSAIFLTTVIVQANASC